MSGRRDHRPRSRVGRPRRRSLAVTLGFAALAVLAAACEPDGGAGEPPRSPHPPIVGEVLPAYSAPTLEGDTVRLRDYRGRALLFNVWATWCPACEREMPSLQKLHEDLGPSGLEVVGVSIDAGPGSERTVRDFLAEHGITYTILHDPRSRITDAYRIVGIPTTYLADREGRLVERWIGEVDFGAPEVRRAVRRALGTGGRGFQ